MAEPLADKVTRRIEQAAEHGKNLLKELSREPRRHEISNSGRRQLYGYLAFYRTHPQIVRTLSAQLGISPEKLLGSLSYSHFEQLSALEDDSNVPFTKSSASGATGRFGSNLAVNPTSALRA